MPSHHEVVIQVRSLPWRLLRTWLVDQINCQKLLVFLVPQHCFHDTIMLSMFAGIGNGMVMNVAQQLLLPRTVHPANLLGQEIPQPLLVSQPNTQ